MKLFYHFIDGTINRNLSENRIFRPAVN